MSDREWRLQRFLARAGLGSRRGCERLILAGRVRVNGSAATELGFRVHPERDIVELDGRRVMVRPDRYLAFHKPPCLLCSRSSADRRKTIYQYLDVARVDTDALLYVGRLDFFSEGLLLLTTDGQWAEEVAHPRYHLPRVYRVWVRGGWHAGLLERCLDGIFDAELQVLLTASSIRKLEIPEAGKTHLLEIELLEGRNRQIRRMMYHLGLRVKRLQRVRVGPVGLGALPVGAVRPLEPWEIDALRAGARRPPSVRGHE